MAEGPQFSAADFGASFKGFLDKVVAHAPGGEPPFVKKLQQHFGLDPASLPIISEEFEIPEHPNLQLAIDAWLEGPGRTCQLLGVVGGQFHQALTMADLVSPSSSRMGMPSAEGPVQYTNVPLQDDEVLSCVNRGLYLIQAGDRRLGVLVRGPSEMGFPRKLHLEVMAKSPEEAREFLHEIRRAMRARNVYRGRVVALTQDRYAGMLVEFHRLPSIQRDDIILPAGVLERIERQTIRFSAHREKLLAAKRHLKRGLLLYGPPGTGKTFTSMYLAGNMPDRTVFLLTGRGLGMLEASCNMARLLQPSTVILEDVDLIAEERTRETATCTTLLFDLLNEMDGLAEDVDVLFVLTTNRPDILEPALAARPGRIDQAVEIPLPDAACRRRLFALYAQGLDLPDAALARFAERTEGVSAAFIKELLRRAALFAAEDGEELRVQERHLDEALHEMVVDGGELMQSLLGVAKTKGEPH